VSEYGREPDRRFSGVPAVDGLDLRLAPGKITPAGRNGSGKSTLAATLAGFREPSDGRVLIESDEFDSAREPYEDAIVTSRVCLIRESGDLTGNASVKNVLGLASVLRPYWDADLAAELLDKFELSPASGRRSCPVARSPRWASSSGSPVAHR